MAGGAALFEGLAQAAERMVYPEHWDMLLRGMSRDQYLGFYASVFMTYGLDRADSQEGFNRAFETFIALCDLALQTPIGSIYGPRPGRRCSGSRWRATPLARSPRTSGSTRGHPSGIYPWAWTRSTPSCR